MEMAESDEGGGEAPLNKGHILYDRKNMDLTDKIKICLLPQETKVGFSKMPYQQCKVELRKI